MLTFLLTHIKVPVPDPYPHPHGSALIFVAGSGSRNAKIISGFELNYNFLRKKSKFSAVKVFVIFVIKTLDLKLITWIRNSKKAGSETLIRMLFDGGERREGAYEYCNILPGLYPRDWVTLLDMFSYRVVITAVSLP
jgi:hypothetical protein